MLVFDPQKLVRAKPGNEAVVTFDNLNSFPAKFYALQHEQEKRHRIPNSSMQQNQMAAGSKIVIRHPIFINSRWNEIAVHVFAIPFYRSRSNWGKRITPYHTAKQIKNF